VTGLAAVAVGPRIGIRGASVAERTIAAWALIAALGLRTISSPLKSMAQAERPSSAYDLRITHDLTSYGFPSGHVLGDVVVFGTLAVFAPLIVGRTAGAAMRVFCLAIILLAGPARMTVGAHWPSDVAGGYLWGGAALCVGLFFGRRMAAGR
jgi:undecaprenyl-diphosphatase